MKSILVLIAACTLAMSVFAKLPALSDEAKAKAAEAAAKAAHAGKVDAYKLCKSQDRTVAYYKKGSKGGAEKSTCVDPGAFVYTPAAPAAAAPAATPVAAAATAPAAKK